MIIVRLSICASPSPSAALLNSIETVYDTDESHMPHYYIAFVYTIFNQYLSEIFA